MRKHEIVESITGLTVQECMVLDFILDRGSVWPNEVVLALADDITFSEVHIALRHLMEKGLIKKCWPADTFPNCTITVCYERLTIGGDSMMKKTNHQRNDTVKITDQCTECCGDERLEKRKAYLKATIRSAFFGAAGGLCLRFPIVLLLVALFLAYVLCEEVENA